MSLVNQKASFISELFFKTDLYVRVIIWCLIFHYGFRRLSQMYVVSSLLNWKADINQPIFWLFFLTLNLVLIRFKFLENSIYMRLIILFFFQIICLLSVNSCIDRMTFKYEVINFNKQMKVRAREKWRNVRLVRNIVIKFRRTF